MPMKWNIYINQKKAIEWELSFAESILVDLFTAMPLWAENDNWWYFFAKPKILEEAPMLSKKGNIDTIYKQIKGLVEKELLLHKKVGIKDFWKLSSKIKEWQFSEKNLTSSEKNPKDSSEKNPTYNNTSKAYNNTNNTKEESEELYIFYNTKIKRAWGSSFINWNKKALSLERIQKLLKTKSKADIEAIILLYIKKERESIAKDYAKACQYFFWAVEKGSKVMYYDDYIPSGEEPTKRIGIDIDASLDF